MSVESSTSEVGRSAPKGAVFLSYASQDAEAAKRIADALRGAGVEVWFDAEGGLEHGDEWDAKIRRQIKECVLFIPLISANTQAREEGYFRIEWELAAQRALGIASGVAFILPVLIDGTKETQALVPDRFRSVQWTKLPDGHVPGDVLERFLKLWSHRTGTLKHQSGARRDETHHGDDHPAPASASSRASKKSVVPYVFGGFAVAACAAAVLWLVKSPRGPENRPPTKPTAQPATPVAPAQVQAEAVADKSIAVLAFANLSDDKANDYFSDGISEELLNVLAKVPGLRVSARTSAFYFKGKDTPIPEIAQKLGVAYVVEGSVRKSGDKVRITAQLIKAADGFHVWSDTFTRDVKDIFAVQDEIAGLIARNLELRIGTNAPAHREMNPEAVQLYLEGKFYMNRATLEDAARATALFERVVALEPKFAAAWAALSGAGWFRGGYGLSRKDFEEGYALARRAAARAIEIDPQLAAGYLSLLDVQGSVDFNWAGAQESMRRAKALAPDDPEVLFRESQLAFTFGDLPRAIDLIDRVVRLDPVHAQVHMSRGYYLLAAQRFDEAAAAFRQLAELSPTAPWGHAGVTLARIGQGRADEAAAEAEKETNEWSRLYALALARWAQGRKAEADAVLAQFIKADADVAAYQIATVYAYRGDKDDAFAWLERAYRQNDPGLSWGLADFLLRGLHSDPRWPIFLKKLGLAGALSP